MAVGKQLAWALGRPVLLSLSFYSTLDLGGTEKGSLHESLNRMEGPNLETGCLLTLHMSGRQEDTKLSSGAIQSESTLCQNLCWHEQVLRAFQTCFLTFQWEKDHACLSAL